MTTCLIADVVIGFQMRKPNGMKAASRKARRQSLTAKKHDEQSEREVSAFSGVGVRGSCVFQFGSARLLPSLIRVFQTCRRLDRVSPSQDTHPRMPSREVTTLHHPTQRPVRQNQEGSTESRPPRMPSQDVTLGCFPRCSPRR